MTVRLAIFAGVYHPQIAMAALRSTFLLLALAGATASAPAASSRSLARFSARNLKAESRLTFGTKAVQQMGMRCAGQASVGSLRVPSPRLGSRPSFAVEAVKQQFGRYFVDN